MASYYVNRNAQPNGDHEVHKEGCVFMPEESNRLYLGEYFTCPPAVQKAQQYYSQTNGCYYCSSACHTT